ncbi:hypothetical protein [Glutamicibacter creatinolyticus]|uniref:hypothetical protein n=1 Tax=Glutamicibacter creatinolyticus TaxID=162496 RepID=UPI003216F7A7
MNLSTYLSLLEKSESTLAESFRQVAEGHGHEPDVHFICQTLPSNATSTSAPCSRSCGATGRATSTTNPNACTPTG